jgi:lipopolysaccharide transport system ATP-binding protein
MYVRLAFAVAAHLEPEILIVDEVLAVGDAEFQQKCLGKMQDISRGEGRTVLFVSHSLPAILNLCTTAICLDKGAVAQRGKPEAVCASYASFRASSQRFATSASVLKSISVLDEVNEPSATVIQGQHLKFRLVLTPPDEKCIVSLIIRDLRNAILFDLFDDTFSLRKAGNSNVVVEVDAGILPFLPGRYSADFWCGDRMSSRMERIDSVIEFEVVVGRVMRMSSSETKPVNFAYYSGSFYCQSNWRLV